MELLLFLALVAGGGYYLYNRFGNKPRSARYLSGTGTADLEAVVPPTFEPPPSPAMTPPQDGTMSVAIHRDTDAVWAWVLVTETTKQALSKVMKAPVDEYPLDIDQAERRVREFKVQIEQTFTTPPFSKTERDLKIQDSLAKVKKLHFTPRPILLRDFIAGPFRYPVSSAQEGAEYVDRLKTRVFPKIKGMIEAQSRPRTETFEL